MSTQSAGLIINKSFQAIKPWSNGTHYQVVFEQDSCAEGYLGFVATITVYFQYIHSQKITVYFQYIHSQNKSLFFSFENRMTFLPCNIAECSSYTHNPMSHY